MRKALRAVPILLTVLFVAVGACIPLVASQLVDRQLEYETKHWEDTSVSLVLSQEGDFFQTLELFRSDHSQVELSEGEAMTVEEVREAAMNAALLLALQAPMQEELRVVPILFASSGTPVSSGIFWRCTWFVNETQTTLWLDDRSGRMVAFESWVGTSDLYASDSPFHEAVFSVLEYCQTQYPVDSVDYDFDLAFAEEGAPSAATEGEANSSAAEEAGGAAAAAEGKEAEALGTDQHVSFTVNLSRTVDGRTEQCGLPLQLEGERLFFNL